MLTVTCTVTNQSMSLTRDDARDLELKLNVTSKGRTWASLGSALFDFHSTGNPAITDITPEQFLFLELLQTKNGYESCRRL
jgi:hypothetical protein